MTISANQRLRVVSRITSRKVTENQRRPVVAVVAVVALQTCDEMRRAFSGRGTAIMTTGTGSRDIIVIKTRRKPRNG